jgi:hypothetical protein
MRKTLRVGAVGVAMVATLTAMQAAEEPSAPTRGAGTAVIACDSHGLPVGFSLVCGLVVRDASGTLSVATTTAAWSSSNHRLATVSSNGLVRSVGGAGTVNIAATALVNGQAIAANRVITVGANSRAASLNPSIVSPGSSRIRVGEQILLDCAARDDNGRSPPVYATTWRTASSDIAIVSPIGLLTAVSPGTAAITCSSHPASAALTITVVR